MANQIRWRQNDVQELRKAVTNFNKKVRRLEKLENEVLPDTINYRQIKKEINTRQDLNNLINSLKRFSKRGAENPYTLQSGETITTWERRELGIKSRSAQIKLQNEIKRLKTQDVKVGGINTGFSYAEMGNTKIRELEAKINAVKNIENRKGEQLSKLRTRLNNYTMSSLELQKAQTFKDNYIKTIKGNFYNMQGYKELLQKLEKISPNNFYNLIKNDDVAVDIPFMYDSKGAQTVFNRIIGAWESATGQPILESNDEEL